MMINILSLRSLLQNMKKSSDGKGLKITIITIIIIVLTYFSWFAFQGHHCRKLRGHGFSYEIEGGLFSKWDYVSFYFFSSPEKTGVGPIIGGGPLQVKCRDVTGDGLPEYIIFHKRYEEEQTILQVDLDSGMYHIYFTNGLKVHYPPEGFYADF